MNKLKELIEWAFYIGVVNTRVGARTKVSRNGRLPQKRERLHICQFSEMLKNKIGKKYFWLQHLTFLPLKCNSLMI